MQHGPKIKKNLNEQVYKYVLQDNKLFNFEECYSMLLYYIRNGV